MIGKSSNKNKTVERKSFLQYYLTVGSRETNVSKALDLFDEIDFTAFNNKTAEQKKTTVVQNRIESYFDFDNETEDTTPSSEESSKPVALSEVVESNTAITHVEETRKLTTQELLAAANKAAKDRREASKSDLNRGVSRPETVIIDNLTDDSFKEEENKRRMEILKNASENGTLKKVMADKAPSESTNPYFYDFPRRSMSFTVAAEPGKGNDFKAGNFLEEELHIKRSAKAGDNEARETALAMIIHSSLKAFELNETVWMTFNGSVDWWSKKTDKRVGLRTAKLVRDALVENGYLEEHEFNHIPAAKTWRLRNSHYGCRQIVVKSYCPTRKFFKILKGREWINNAPELPEGHARLKVEVLSGCNKHVNLNAHKSEGRFFHSLSNTSKNKRRQWKINGEQAVEIDFKSCHFTMMYHEKGLNLPNGDAYDFGTCWLQDTFTRPLRKKITNAIINCTKKGNSTPEKQFYGMIRKEMRDEGISPAGITDDFLEKNVISVIKVKHAPIQDNFFKGATRFFKMEGRIMQELRRSNTPSFVPFHDSFIFPASKAEEGKKNMIKCWQKVVKTNLVPEVK